MLIAHSGLLESGLHCTSVTDTLTLTVHCIHMFLTMSALTDKYHIVWKFHKAEIFAIKHQFVKISSCKHFIRHSFPVAVLRNTTYRNNSIVMLEEIGEGDDALLCITNQTACCRRPHTGEMGPAIGNWFFPNGTRVPSDIANGTSGEKWDLYRDRGQMVVHMNRRRGGVEGIYRCEIPDAMNVNQTIYIGVYSPSTGEWSFCSRHTPLLVFRIQIWSESIFCKVNIVGRGSVNRLS